jgi:magnesium-transporting ATPase (P-type)
MIREAHVGVGLYGNEGLRAAQTADMAIGEFRFLWRLLFWHCVTAYMRNSELILYFFYKCMLFTVPHLLFTYLNLFSGFTVYDEWFISLYNTFFTACPNNFRACADLVIHPELDGEQLKQKLPDIYYVGRLNTIFTNRNFAYWFGWGTM